MKYVGILSVLALSIAGFAYYTLVAGPSIPQAVNSDVTADQRPGESAVVVTDPEAREEFAGAGSLNNLFARRESIECQITYIPNPVEPAVVGTFFTANGNVRGDFLIPTPDLNGQMLSSFIFDGSMIYVWTEIDDDMYGFKVESNGLTADAATPIPTDTEIQYDCLTWPAVDYTIFEPPTDVLFADAASRPPEMEIGTIYLEEEAEF